MDRGKQIETGLVDFVPHPPSRVDAYAYLEELMEMTFGRFHFRVGKEGSHRLAIPDSSRSVAVNSDSLGSASSFKSGEEEISPSIFTKPASSGKLIKIFSSMSFGSSADSNISSDSDSVDTFDFIDRSTSVREVLADLYDGVTDLEEKQIPKYHQICVIGESSRPEAETLEAFDDAGNPYVDPADLMRGATYQRMMQKCLATQIGKNVQVYIDDVVITTKHGSTLIEDLKETFDNLDRFCLKLNPTKCSFGVPAGELLGFLVSARGIEANPEKIQAIVTMRKPTKLKEIQQLTGRVAALSRFVARLGEKALPFYALIKQGEKFEWNKEEDRAFEDLKRTISTPPILVAPKEKEPLLLYIAATPQLAPTVGQREALAGVHIRAGILDVNGEHTVSALVQRIYNMDFINDNAGCFANGGKFPQNGRTIEFGSHRVSSAPSVRSLAGAGGAGSAKVAMCWPCHRQRGSHDGRRSHHWQRSCRRRSWAYDIDPCGKTTAGT
ncbi:hypothetical protein QYE76_064749 [Lolium multiflorum]|uniref:Reverse transcriptase domain-containing protein n=1 Tax=Lolium multiflorum TaxID=4521 RepID=A0AAD8S801_LOLMU|nr:hypothetical protein QYE76_064749 [Lolium multiflorum]